MSSEKSCPGPVVCVCSVVSLGESVAHIKWPTYVYFVMVSVVDIWVFIEFYFHAFTDVD